MSTRYPPLTPKQVCKILEAWQFEFVHYKGDHRIYEDDKGHNVQVDMGERDFGIRGMKIIIDNSGLSRDEFYGATKQSANKARLPFKKKRK